MVSRSMVSASSSRCAVTSSVPPGVSYAPRDFMPDEAIFDNVGAANAVLCGNFIERVEKIDGTELRAVNADRGACLKTDFDFFGFVWSFFRRDSPLPHGFVWRVGGIFELAAFVAEVPDVTVATVDIFLALFHLHVVFLRRRRWRLRGSRCPTRATGQ